MIKQLQASRTCSVCGQKKPLVAFLQLAGDKGHIYGDICASCRSAGLGQKKNAGDTEPFGSNTRLQIDIKTKVQLEKDKKKQLKEHLQRDQIDKAKKDKLEVKEIKDEKKREDAEKKQRDKKESAAPASKVEAPKTVKDNKHPTTQGFYQEKSRVNKEFTKQAEGQQLGKKKQGITPQYINQYVSATGRSVESLFGNLMGQFVRQLQGNKNPAKPEAKQQQAATPNKAISPQTTFAGKAKAPEAKKAESKENPVTEFVRKNFGKR